ncbi:hypothetical protein BDZ89DRAFT_1112405 [Hymenopellis radicata]|nr:hypothetical protein BDZ89DRAFT_1112405 [Hymenopellis radicata]
MALPLVDTASPIVEFNEKVPLVGPAEISVNPVVKSAEFAYNRTNLVQISSDGVQRAAKHIHGMLLAESYTPRTWRTQPLHLIPTEPHHPDEPWNRSVLNWIFLISALNFSFWSEREGRNDRYGVEWQRSWTSQERTVHTGYWSLVAALNRALQDDAIPITDPQFYASETLCPDSVIESTFRPAAQCAEGIPLLRERIAVMREVGDVLCRNFNGSFHGLLEEFQRRHNGDGTALDLVEMVIEYFPSFRDEHQVEGRKVCIWKRAQILVADTWAAFYPASPDDPHPLFPGPRGAQIHQLTMFADYRVPQILHHLKILSGTYLPSGCMEELSLRAASIVAVERVRDAMIDMNLEGSLGERVSSVVIDFFLWDLAKRVERGEEKLEGIETEAVVPAHRTRSIWY